MLAFRVVVHKLHQEHSNDWLFSACRPGLATKLVFFCFLFVKKVIAVTAPFKGPRLACVLFLELQRNKNTVGCASLLKRGGGRQQEQLTQTLIVRLLKTHFFTSILDFE